MSTLWIIAIIVLSMGMVAGPALALRLGKGAQRQQQLRSKARELGLQVSMEPLPQREGDKGHTLIAVYRLQLHKHLPKHINHCARRSRIDHNEWMFLRNRPPLEQYEALLKLYKKLPADVEAIDCQSAVISAWWHERGGESSLQALQQQLQQIADIQYPH